MIRPLRQRHRITVFVLSVLMPAVFGLGIVSRKSVPAVAPLPFASGETRQYSEVWARNDLWPKLSFSTRLLMEKGNTTSRAIEISPKENIARPDLLLYWVRGKPKSLDALPEDAILLGAFVATPATPLPIPAEAVNQTGSLILYSLADQEVLAVSAAFDPK